MVPCSVTLNDFQTRHAGLSVSIELLVTSVLSSYTKWYIVVCCKLDSCAWCVYRGLTVVHRHGTWLCYSRGEQVWVWHQDWHPRTRLEKWNWRLLPLHWRPVQLGCSNTTWQMQLGFSDLSWPSGSQLHYDRRSPCIGRCSSAHRLMIKKTPHVDSCSCRLAIALPCSVIFLYRNDSERQE